MFFFSKTFKPCLGSTQVPGKHRSNKAGRTLLSPQPSAKLKNEWSSTSASSVSLNGVDGGKKCTFVDAWRLIYLEQLSLFVILDLHRLLWNRQVICFHDFVRTLLAYLTGLYYIILYYIQYNPVIGWSVISSNERDVEESFVAFISALQNCDKLLKASSCLNVRPSPWHNSARTGRIFLIFDYFFKNRWRNFNFD
jgi:hypothetical protein